MRGLNRLMLLLLGELIVRESTPAPAAVVEEGQTASRACDTGLIAVILLFGTGIVVAGKNIWLAGLLQTPAELNPSGQSALRSPERKAASGTNIPDCGWLPCCRIAS